MAANILDVFYIHISCSFVLILILSHLFGSGMKLQLPTNTNHALIDREVACPFKKNTACGNSENVISKSQVRSIHGCAGLQPDRLL